MDDLYQTLGVQRDATAEEIKKAYRAQAFKYHPDRNAGDTSAEEKFKRVNEAYSVLGDEAKRRQYDSSGTADGYAREPHAYGGAAYTGAYGFSSADPFWQFFSAAQDAGQSRRTYTWTSYAADEEPVRRNVTRGDGIMLLGRNLLKVIVGSVFLRTPVVWFFLPLAFVCLGAIGSGIIGAVRSLKYIFQPVQK